MLLSYFIPCRRSWFFLSQLNNVTVWYVVKGITFCCNIPRNHRHILLFSPYNTLLFSSCHLIFSILHGTMIYGNLFTLLHWVSRWLFVIIGFTWIYWVNHKESKHDFLHREFNEILFYLGKNIFLKCRLHKGCYVSVKSHVRLVTKGRHRLKEFL